MAQWNLAEARLVQERLATSAADATQLAVGNPGPTLGKIWHLIGFGYMPDAAETRVISILKSTRTGGLVALLNPVSMALNPAMATFIEQGLEHFLLPGEFIYVIRDDHTAGSTMSARLQFIEADLPLYTYDEPQIVKRQARALSSVRQALGGGISRGGSGGVAPIGGARRGPGGGGPAPI